VDALRDLGFRYTTTHAHVHDLRRRVRVMAIALSNRPRSSLERVGSAAVQTAPALLGLHGVVRLALHPQDLAAGLGPQTMRVVDRLLEAGGRPVTYQRLLGLAAVVAG
jgi:hypothetical protein